MAKKNFARAAQMHALYSTGASLEDVGIAFGCDARTVARVLRKNGYPVRAVRGGRKKGKSHESH